MIYLDNGATTKVHSTSLQKAVEFQEEFFINPSASYKLAVELQKQIKLAKQSLLKHFPFNYDVVFTSGGTESDNLAVNSFCKRGEAICSSGEHSAIYESMNQFKKQGHTVHFAPIDSLGRVKPNELIDLVNDKTTFVSIVHVNNETGGLNDINELARLVKQKNPRVIFHSDGVQAFAKINYKLNQYIDCYSFSGHKINGLKGIGGLFFKKGINLVPQILGGGQQQALRSGTENVLGIKMMQYVAEYHYENIDEFYKKVSALKQLCLDGFDREIFHIENQENTSPYILSIHAKGLRAEVLMHILEDEGVIVGKGSACSSKSRHSRILTACGYNASVLDGALRISFDCLTEETELIKAIKIINESAKILKGKIGKNG